MSTGLKIGVLLAGLSKERSGSPGVGRNRHEPRPKMAERSKTMMMRRPVL